MTNILVACGNGVATSTMVALKIKEALKKENLNVNVTQCKLMEIPSKAADYDLIVTTGRYTQEINKPIIGGMPLLTGIGEEEKLKEIVEFVKERN
ncbi:PTS sugar transporter subunit IIB [Anaerococcus lactolyticus]|uniref:PTS galactitol transporter subunit IIB n=1 Tax=Anaerococcus lactolyticus S7-1-13 TaxID=1284686 RepID=A0A095YI31_9FIRM|nr:PTS sugar transporter subunit IIB [Anaerococcus lactolyticus]KGF06187.1 PTS galactitol transporter subunit IIB [Anaerococcus lactolyticus S7-1-13]